ncbi:dCTP deaminase domain-containing protein [Aureimonas sp. N4]|uniref:dCTP deaminase domain-containing protein n=1 Tax=Aureimonas sp. N4 TaxID=1638165 RepID=UPI000ACA65F8|nr:hypothetical protein [Aureimonas sp. N4]
MSFWSLSRWQSEAPNIVESPGNHEVEFKDGCFRLSLGDEAYTSCANAKDLRHDFEKQSVLTLDPGQFAYLITLERLHMPLNSIGLINVRTDLKLEGLINVSGFHADPGYCGKLVFGVFNAGPRAICLSRRDRIFRLWIVDYDGTTEEKVTKGYEAIPRSLIQNLVGSYPSSFLLQQQINDQAQRLAKLEGGRFKSGLTVAILILLITPFIISLYTAVFAPLLSKTITPNLPALWSFIFG